MRVITPRDGLGDYPGTLSQAAANVVRWAQQGWQADVFLEAHTNAGPRGCFVVYPDWADDLDVDVRDRLGPDIAGYISGMTGIPIFGDGTMSERSTAVGAAGFRLGVFAATAPARGYCSRLIVEFGAHSQEADLAILKAEGFCEKAAAAVADALEDC